MPDEKLLAIKDRAAAEFFKIPGVTGVGLGGRERDGRPTGEFVIKVFVRQKRPPEELTPGEMLPPQFEGIGVDVSILGETHLEMSNPSPPPGPQLPPGSWYVPKNETDDKLYRPLIGGCRVEVDLAGAGLGTGGSLWKHATDASKRYLLTNFHVVADTGPNGPAPVAGTTRLGQPTKESAPTKCCSDIVGTYAGGGRDTIWDAALVQLDPGTRYRAEVKGIGAIAGTYDIDPTTDLLQPYPVRKYGARTRLTGGTVEAVNTTQGAGGFTRKNVMVVKPKANPYLTSNQTLYFSDEGDSGSALVNKDNKIVGLHYAGDDTAAYVHKGLALPIKDIIDSFATNEHLAILPETATKTDDVRTVPGTRPVAPPRELERTLTGALPSYGTALSRVGADLSGTAAGRDLRALWFDHHEELLDLVDHRRRVTIAWHRGGGPALLQTLIRMSADPALAMPATVNGEPPMRRLANIHAVVRANASPELRAALDRALTAVPDPAGLTYDQIMAALATR